MDLSASINSLWQWNGNGEAVEAASHVGRFCVSWLEDRQEAGPTWPLLHMILSWQLPVQRDEDDGVTCRAKFLLFTGKEMATELLDDDEDERTLPSFERGLGIHLGLGSIASSVSRSKGLTLRLDRAVIIEKLL